MPVRPPFDVNYKNASGIPNPDQTLELDVTRKTMLAMNINEQFITQQQPEYKHITLTAPGVSGLSDHPVTISGYQSTHGTRRTWPAGRPVVYFVHGGGQIAGDRFMGVTEAMAHFSPADDVFFVSPEYRLAPEHPAPAGAHDVYAGLVYLVSHATELGIDPARIVLYGCSGGAAIAASTCLLARQLNGHRVAALLLNIPMLDDRHEEYVSASQFRTDTVWPGWTDEWAWNAILGSNRDDPSGVRVAGRAQDLSNLPPTFIDVGACEVFRDAAVRFATRIWQVGGIAELHVWPGVYHAASMFEPDVAVGRDMNQCQQRFLHRILNMAQESK
ncbi:alpha beta hydrolase fold-3 [Stemphylium lycopersici]|nr:alpha beta hydrolase fold-3 [Stemphylium lycopersici]